MAGSNLGEMEAGMKLFTLKIIPLAAVIVALFGACGGDSSSGSSRTATPAFTPTPPQNIAQPSPTATNVPTVATQPPVTVPAELSGEEQIARGEELFQKTAGGVGCALCHGVDAMGDPAQGAPSNFGASAESIEQALYDRPQMSFIQLSRDEIKSIAAYLQYLKEQQ